MVHSNFFIKSSVLRSGHEYDGLGLVLVPLGYLPERLRASLDEAKAFFEEGDIAKCLYVIYNFFFFSLLDEMIKEKSRIRETLTLSACADSSTKEHTRRKKNKGRDGTDPWPDES